MFDRMSINAILKSVIVIMDGATAMVLAFRAWSPWSRLSAINRIAAVADASGYMFTALHNLRVDRASSFRDLQADKQFGSIAPLLREAREAEMPALKSAMVALNAVDFPDPAVPA